MSNESSDEWIDIKVFSGDVKDDEELDKEQRYEDYKRDISTGGSKEEWKNVDLPEEEWIDIEATEGKEITSESEEREAYGMSDTEELGQNLKKGILELVDYIPSVDTTLDIKEIDDEIKKNGYMSKKHDGTTTSLIYGSMLESTRYLSDIVYMIPAVGALGMTKKGANLLKGVGNIYRRGNAKQRYSTSALLSALENVTSDTVRGEIDDLQDFAESAGIGAVFGPILNGVADTFGISAKAKNTKAESQKEAKVETDEFVDIEEVVKDFESETKATSPKPEKPEVPKAETLDIKDQKKIKSDIEALDKEESRILNKHRPVYKDDNGNEITKTEFNKIGIEYRKKLKGKEYDQPFVAKHIDLIDKEPDWFSKKGTVEFEDISVGYKGDDGTIAQKLNDLDLSRKELIEQLDVKTPKKVIIDESTDLFSVETKDIPLTIADTPDNTFNPLVDEIQKFVPFNVRFSPSPKGRYDTTAGQDGISRNIVTGKKEGDLAHEFMHSATVHAYNSVPKFRKRIDDVFGEVVNKVDDSDLKTLLNTPEEMMANIANSPRLVKQLNDIEYKNTGRSALSKIKDLVAQVVSKFYKDFKVKKNSSLEEILDAVDEVNMKNRKDIDYQKPLGKIYFKEGDVGVKKGIGENVPYAIGKAIDKMATKFEPYSKIKKAVSEFGFSERVKVDWDMKGEKIRDQISSALSKTSNIEKIANSQSRNIKEILVSKLKKYSKDDRKKFHRAIVDTEVARMYDNGSREKIMNSILSGESTVDSFIESISKVLDSNTIKDVNNLAKFMKTGEGNTGLKLNPYQISKANGGADVDAIERLTILKSLSNEDVDTLKMLSKDKKAYRDLIGFQKVNNYESDAIFTGQESRRMFGYSRDKYNDSIEFKVVTRSESDDLINESLSSTLGWKEYKNIGTDKVMIYRKDLDPEFRKGIVPTQKMSYSGELMFKPSEAKRLSQDDMRMIADGEGGGAIPIRNKNGDIVNFRYMMTKEDKRKLLGLEEDISETIPNTMQSIIRKGMTKRVLPEIIEDFVEVNPKKIDLTDAKSAFVLASSYKDIPNDVRNKFVKLTKEELEILPEEMKALAKERKTGIFVRKDTRDIIMGYREFFFSGSDNRRGIYAEKVWKGLVQSFKENILKYPVVTMNNFISNNMLLLLHGVKPDEIYRYSKEAFKGLEELKKLEKKRQFYKMKVISGDTKYQKRLDNIEKSIKNNNMAKAQDKGFIQSITEEVFIDGMFTDNLFKQEVGKAYDKMAKASKFGDRLPKTKANFDKYFNEIYAGEGSKYFTSVTKAMQYSDYMARWALYRSKINAGVPEKEAIELAIRYILL
jgi:hypothetical protein